MLAHMPPLVTHSHGPSRAVGAAAWVARVCLATALVSAALAGCGGGSGTSSSSTSAAGSKPSSTAAAAKPVVPTSAQVCAKLPLPAMTTLTSDKWASAEPSDGLIGCTLMSPDPASLNVRLDDAATKAPDQTRAAALAKTFFESETSDAAYQAVPGVRRRGQVPPGDVRPARPHRRVGLGRPTAQPYRTRPLPGPRQADLHPRLDLSRSRTLDGMIGSSAASHTRLCSTSGYTRPAPASRSRSAATASVNPLRA